MAGTTAVASEAPKTISSEAWQKGRWFGRFGGGHLLATLDPAGIAEHLTKAAGTADISPDQLKETFLALVRKDNYGWLSGLTDEQKTSKKKEMLLSLQRFSNNCFSKNLSNSTPPASSEAVDFVFTAIEENKNLRRYIDSIWGDRTKIHGDIQFLQTLIQFDAFDLENFLERYPKTAKRFGLGLLYLKRWSGEETLRILEFAFNDPHKEHTLLPETDEEGSYRKLLINVYPFYEDKIIALQKTKKEEAVVPVSSTPSADFVASASSSMAASAKASSTSTTSSSALPSPSSFTAEEKIALSNLGELVYEWPKMDKTNPDQVEVVIKHNKELGSFLARNATLCDTLARFDKAQQNENSNVPLTPQQRSLLFRLPVKEGLYSDGIIKKSAFLNRHSLNKHQQLEVVSSIVVREGGSGSRWVINNYLNQFEWWSVQRKRVRPIDLIRDAIRELPDPLKLTNPTEAEETAKNNAALVNPILENSEIRERLALTSQEKGKGPRENTKKGVDIFGVFRKTGFSPITAAIIAKNRSLLEKTLENNTVDDITNSAAAKEIIKGAKAFWRKVKEFEDSKGWLKNLFSDNIKEAVNFFLNQSSIDDGTAHFLANNHDLWQKYVFPTTQKRKWLGLREDLTEMAKAQDKLIDQNVIFAVNIEREWCIKEGEEYETPFITHLLEVEDNKFSKVITSPLILEIFLRDPKTNTSLLTSANSSQAEEINIQTVLNLLSLRDKAGKTILDDEQKPRLLLKLMHLPLTNTEAKNAVDAFLKKSENAALIKDMLLLDTQAKGFRPAGLNLAKEDLERLQSIGVLPQLFNEEKKTFYRQNQELVHKLFTETKLFTKNPGFFELLFNDQSLTNTGDTTLSSNRRDFREQLTAEQLYEKFFIADKDAVTTPIINSGESSSSSVASASAATPSSSTTLKIVSAGNIPALVTNPVLVWRLFRGFQGNLLKRENVDAFLSTSANLNSSTATSASASISSSTTSAVIGTLLLSPPPLLRNGQSLPKLTADELIDLSDLKILETLSGDAVVKKFYEANKHAIRDLFSNKDCDAEFIEKNAALFKLCLSDTERYGVSDTFASTLTAEQLYEKFFTVDVKQEGTTPNSGGSSSSSAAFASAAASLSTSSVPPRTVSAGNVSVLSVNPVLVWNLFRGFGTSEKQKRDDVDKFLSNPVISALLFPPPSLVPNKPNKPLILTKTEELIRLGNLGILGTLLEKSVENFYNANKKIVRELFLSERCNAEFVQKNAALFKFCLNDTTHYASLNGTSISFALSLNHSCVVQNLFLNNNKIIPGFEDFFQKNPKWALNIFSYHDSKKLYLLVHENPTIFAELIPEIIELCDPPRMDINNVYDYRQGQERLYALLGIHDDIDEAFRTCYLGEHGSAGVNSICYLRNTFLLCQAIVHNHKLAKTFADLLLHITNIKLDYTILIKLAEINDDKINDIIFGDLKLCRILIAAKYKPTYEQGKVILGLYYSYEQTSSVPLLGAEVLIAIVEHQKKYGANDSSVAATSATSASASASNSVSASTDPASSSSGLDVVSPTSSIPIPPPLPIVSTIPLSAGAPAGARTLNANISALPGRFSLRDALRDSPMFAQVNADMQGGDHNGGDHNENDSDWEEPGIGERSDMKNHTGLPGAASINGSSASSTGTSDSALDVTSPIGKKERVQSVASAVVSPIANPVSPSSDVSIGGRLATTSEESSVSGNQDASRDAENSTADQSVSTVFSLPLSTGVSPPPPPPIQAGLLLYRSDIRTIQEIIAENKAKRQGQGSTTISTGANSSNNRPPSVKRSVSSSSLDPAQSPMFRQAAQRRAEEERKVTAANLASSTAGGMISLSASSSGEGSQKKNLDADDKKLVSPELYSDAFVSGLKNDLKEFEQWPNMRKALDTLIKERDLNQSEIDSFKSTWESKLRSDSALQNIGRYLLNEDDRKLISPIGNHTKATIANLKKGIPDFKEWLGMRQELEILTPENVDKFIDKWKEKLGATEKKYSIGQGTPQHYAVLALDSVGRVIKSASSASPIAVSPLSPRGVSSMSTLSRTNSNKAITKPKFVLASSSSVISVHPSGVTELQKTRAKIGDVLFTQQGKEQVSWIVYIKESDGLYSAPIDTSSEFDGIRGILNKVTSSNPGSAVSAKTELHTALCNSACFLWKQFNFSVVEASAAASSPSIEALVSPRPGM